MLKDKLVLVKRLFPLLGLHVAETETAARRRVVWELSQCSLVFFGGFRPLAIPAIAVGSVHSRAECLSVPRHKKVLFLGNKQCRNLPVSDRKTGQSQSS